MVLIEYIYEVCSHVVHMGMAIMGDGWVVMRLNIGGMELCARVTPCSNDFAICLGKYEYKIGQHDEDEALVEFLRDVQFTMQQTLFYLEMRDDDNMITTTTINDVRDWDEDFHKAIIHLVDHIMIDVSLNNSMHRFAI
jgi:hypothetical protein